MSRERFDWLKTMAEEVIATPGCESNVKEIFDKCIELEATRPDAVIFNQFDQLPNNLWHYQVTGPAMAEVFTKVAKPGDHVSGAVLSSGSAGTLGSGSFLRDHFPGAKVAVAEALQCPTILENGFGDHRIEGIGDKHIPWIHNCVTPPAIGVTTTAIRFNPSSREAVAKPSSPRSAPRAPTPTGLCISGVGNLIGASKWPTITKWTSTSRLHHVHRLLAMYLSRLDDSRRARPYDQRHRQDLYRLAGNS